jgi:hypothetical protein
MTDKIAELYNLTEDRYPSITPDGLTAELFTDK